MPEVTVIVAVYNTMPYLEQCLTSLVEQSIGTDALQVVAVDDGSTDGSAELLDRFADAYPGVFEVHHQPNSGGPASPSNLALDRATGRYVFFVGADDYLGREALERMVRLADQHGSDVVAPKAVGVGSRFVARGLYAGPDTVDVALDGPHLRWTMSNTKLFRRSLIEAHGLRYREDMAFGSDQPFTLAACVHASRISVLSSYDCYYAVERQDRSNVSFSTGPVERIRCIAQMMGAVADLVPPGAGRDTLLTRHFAWEVPRLLRADLLTRPRGEQAEVCAGVAKLAQTWLTERILAALPVSARLRVSAAAAEDLYLLAALVREDADPALPVHLDGGAAYARYTGFRAPGAGTDLPEHCYRLAPAGVSERVGTGLRAVTSRWSRRSLVVELWLPLVGPEATSALSARLRGTGDDRPADLALPVRTRPGEYGSQVTVEVGRWALLEAGPGAWRLEVYGDLAAGRYRVPVPAPSAPAVTRSWRRGRAHRLHLTTTADGGAPAVRVARVTPREMVRALARRLRPGRR